MWCVVGTTFLLRRPNKANLVEGLLLVIISAVASPFIYFACYFCLLHSYRHYAEYLPRIVTRQDFSIRFVSLLLIMTYLFFIGLFLSLESIGPVEDKSLQTLFWGLASLTVPHMFVIALSKGKKS
ncbi:Brp/Blh family beta-carotene 15,15'-dioxygenase [Photobacterium angustum]|uniref:Brp/Blh family beta-carotene 15,15'-dioxygenase n=1 Tax=Photobacterium angustum TaxID=661 RepID=UPI0024467AA8|nr:Brp/Blh family beta-carotene 15,15'-dioxygenase [Photobacterium angustum]